MTFLQRRFNNHMDQSFYEHVIKHQTNEVKFEVNATSKRNPEFDATHNLMNHMETVIRFLYILYKFIRPYAAVGTVRVLTLIILVNFYNISIQFKLY